MLESQFCMCHVSAYTYEYWSVFDEYSVFFDKAYLESF